MGTGGEVAPAAVTPNAPYLNYVAPGNASATLDFVAPEDNGAVITGYEVSTDGGNVYNPVTVTGTGRLEATVTGLTTARPTPSLFAR